MADGIQRRSRDRAASVARRSVVTAFYGDLDPVRFLRDAQDLGVPAATATASGSLMLGLLLGGTVPLLSYNQAFDGQMILRLASDIDGKAAREDRLAFLRLVRDGYVKVGLLEPVLIDDPPDGQKYTLLNAFRSALARRKTFFSGWPELNGELQELRPDILDRLDNAPGQMEELVGADVAARLEGLRILSANLRQAQEEGLESIRVIRPDPRQQTLEARLRVDLQSGRPIGEGIGPVATWIFDNADRLDINLNLQSEWITWANRYLSEQGAPAGQGVASLKDLVNAHFIQIQAESHGAHGLSLACRDSEAERLLAADMGLSAANGKRLSQLVHDAGQGTWLSWGELPELLDRMALLTTGDAPTTAEARLRYLEADHQDWVGRYAVDRNVGASVRLALPQSVVVAGTTGTEALMTGASPAQAAGVAAVGAIVTLAAATPAARRHERRDRQKIEELEGERWQREFRTGSATWPRRIARHLRNK